MNNNDSDDSPEQVRQRILERRQRRRRSSTTDIIQKFDEKIVRACNDLIQTRAESSKQHAQVSKELLQIQRSWAQLDDLWQQKLKPPRGGAPGGGPAGGGNYRRSSTTSTPTKTTPSSSSGSSPVAQSYQDAVVEVFQDVLIEHKDGAEDQEEPQDKDDSNNETSTTTTELSPYLQSQVGLVCYHVHLMTLGEKQIEKMHQDNRIVVNWLHEEWEKIETVTNTLKEQIKTIQQLRRQLAVLDASDDSKEKVIPNGASTITPLKKKMLDGSSTNRAISIHRKPLDDNCNRFRSGAFLQDEDCEEKKQN